MNVRPSRLFLFLTLSIGVAAYAQQTQTLTGDVVDSAGAVVPNAEVVLHTSQGDRTTTTDRSGQFSIALPGGQATLQVSAHTADLQSQTLTVNSASPVALHIIVSPTPTLQQITVTATRSEIGTAQPTNTAYVISLQQLQQYPATVLDDKLRQQAGFELYRRTSSEAANPTSDGISLRGLGSTAVSRTLILEDQVPLNDPFGGWVHWDELPQDAVSSVELATGGGSDLYGSSALSGVIDVVPASPTKGLFEISELLGGENTSYSSARADIGTKAWRALAGSDVYRTEGYILTAPSVAGPVDQPANVHDQDGHVELDHIANQNRTFLTGNVLNESRNNGTILQNNGTRLWRYILGDDWKPADRISGRGRLFGSEEAYRQTFSTINAARTTEALNRNQHVGTQELGASADLSFSPSRFTAVLGGDARDIRATDFEVPIKNGAPNGVSPDTSSRQRFGGGFGEILAHHGGWSGALSLRADSAENLDTHTFTVTVPSTTSLVLTPNRSEIIVSPRLGILRQVTPSVALHASVFRAFRTPTMNELYRSFQVGAQVTQANSNLVSERGTGWEAGAEYLPVGNLFRAQATYFWTEINRPVSSVAIGTNLFQRQNLGQIQSQGTELHLQIAPEKRISGSVEYQYAHAVVTQYSAQPTLVGNWIPEVPRNSFTAQLRAADPHIGALTLAARSSGQAFDDTANTLPLDGFFELDLYAQHDFGSRWTATFMVQNLTDQRAEIARTPLLNLGSPLLAQGGVSFHWTRSETP